jgi:hypothetical protein
MPENEFEKKIAAGLNDLKLKPSEQVWLQVEERIRKKKKRRGFIILFFFIGIALLGWWQWKNIFGEGTSEIATKELKNQTMTADKTLHEKNNRSKPRELLESKPVASENDNALGKYKKLSENPKETVNKEEKIQKSIASEKSIRVNQDLEKESQPQAKPGNAKTKPLNEKNSAATEMAINADDLQELNKKQASEPADFSTGALVFNISVAKQSTLKLEENKTGEFEKTDSVSVNKIKTDSLIAALNKKNQPSKWKWALHLTPGISSLHENFISLDMNKSADALNYSGSPAGGSAGGGGTSVNIPASPSGSQAAFAFRLGGFVQKQLSSRTSFSSGLQYGYYSDRIRIGGRKDSILQNARFDNKSNADKVYSAANPVNNYTNHYHFIELPVLFHWQLNKNKNYPFTWDMGISLKQMFTTNALVYDTAFGGIYYNDKTAFHKTQFSLFTGLSWTVVNKNNLHWSIGPVVDFFTTRLQMNSLDGRDYLLFFGVRSAILFSSKK